ncbi:MAG: hypothetical protein L6R37_006005 [Teloschistes peruensis]|nr:MAG: hypothetical protein L6R37_006005 [Teloschistes peruensis]
MLSLNSTCFSPATLKSGFRNTTSYVFGESFTKKDGVPFTVVFPTLSHNSAILSNKIKEYLDSRSRIDGEELPALENLSTLEDFNEWFSKSGITKTSHACFVIRRLQRRTFSIFPIIDYAIKCINEYMPQQEINISQRKTMQLRSAGLY